MTKLPKDFQVTDIHRQYCERFGSPYLADVYLEDFVECFEENGKRHKDWDRTFNNFIRNNSPKGRFYNPRYWETKLKAAKAMEYGTRQRKTAAYDVLGREPVPTSKHVVEAAMSKLKRMLSV